MSDDFIFTSESVTAGHPDKLCDQVSDAIVDHVLKQDPDAGINAECAVASGVLFISAHYATEAGIAITDVARGVIRDIGYPSDVFDADACAIMTSFMDHTDRDYRRLDLDAMDDDALGRVTVKDQATVFGYACDQTETLMPLPVTLAHRIVQALGAESLKKDLAYLLPDAKTQVGIEYADGVPKRIHSIALETSQDDADSPGPKQLQADLMERVLQPVLAEAPIQPDGDTLFFINPEGPVIGGGPAVHSGLTGRKSGIDTYGEYARHSGAALSGKDPLRVDRVGAYAARWAAKHVVAAGLAGECEVQLSYSIGAAAPVSVRARTYGSGTIDDAEIAQRLKHVFDFRVGAIVRDLRLRHLPGEGKQGFYRRLACCGHMGRVDLDAPWEVLDRVDALKD